MSNKLSNFVTNWENASSKPAFYAIPIIIFCLVIIIGIVSGIRRGIWGGVTILGFSILGLGIAIGIAPLISNQIIKKIDLKNSTLGLSSPDDAKVILKLLNGLIMLGIILIFNIIGEILIAVLHRPITKNIRIRQDNEKSTFVTRFSGALIAGIGVIPTAVLSANPTGAFAHKSKFVKANDSMLKALSFDKARGVGRFTPGLIGLAKIGLDFTKEKDNTNTLAASLEKYFQQFYNQDNYLYKELPKPSYDETTGTWKSQDIDVQFYFSLVKITDENNGNNYIDKKIPRFFNGDIQKIIDKFTETEESFKLLELILSKIDTSMYSNTKSELEKFIENVKKLSSLGLNTNFKNIEIFGKDWQKLKVPKQFVARIKKLILKIAKLDNLSLDNLSEEDKNKPEYKIRYIIQKMLDTFIVEA